MNTTEQIYFDKLLSKVLEKLNKDFESLSSLDHIFDKLLIDTKETRAVLKFQEYYFQEKAISSKDFFKKFKTQYSLQGIDNHYLGRLQGDCNKLLSLIEEDKIIELYFEYFKEAEIGKEEEGEKRKKDLGSFFTKLVHTFRPNDYCALDNPIKNHFKLSHESFVVAFLIISKAYKIWAQANPRKMEELKLALSKALNQKGIKHEEITDMKVLDLFFWSKENLKT
jgi:hypothetical protein